MQQILFFLIRNKNFLLFIFLLLVSLGLTVQSHSYHNSKFVNSANFFSGGIYSLRSNVTSYFNLKSRNQILVEENARLRMHIEKVESDMEFTLEETSLDTSYRVITAKVINNSYARTKNRLTINKGTNSNISIDMGVITSNGIVGIIDKVSNKYATVQSILNTNSQINAKLKKSNHFASLIWDTSDPNVVQLVDVPMLADVKTGDTIVTGGRSTIFPEGVLIGTVSRVELDEDGNFYDLDIALFNDMTSIGHVYVIENLNSKEIKQLESEGGPVEK